MGEHRFCTAGVGGSNPPSSTTDVNQLKNLAVIIRREKNLQQVGFLRRTLLELKNSHLHDGNLAQLGEHNFYTVGVKGSIPLVPTIMTDKLYGEH